MSKMSTTMNTAINSTYNRNARRAWSVVALFALLLLVPACTDDPNQTKLQYMPDMADQPTVKAQESYIDPPPDSVTQQDVYIPETAEQAEVELQNPLKGLAQEEAFREEGKQLFETFCAVCHGHKAQGDGTIVDVFVKPPDLTQDVYKKRKDGFFYHRITKGTAIMPPYGYAIYPHNRWKVVLYLRALQEAH